MREVAAEPLVEYLAAHSGERVAAALSVAAVLADPRFLAAAMLLCRDGSARVRELAARVAGALGGGQAVQLLTELLSDPAEGVRSSAARSLGKLGYWPSASNGARSVNVINASRYADMGRAPTFSDTLVEVRRADS